MDIPISPLTNVENFAMSVERPVHNVPIYAKIKVRPSCKLSTVESPEGIARI